MGWFESDRSNKLSQFKATVSDKANFDLFVSSIDQMLIKVIGGKVSIFDLRNDLDIRQYDIVHLRNVDVGAQDYVVALTNYVKFFGGVVFEEIDTQLFSGGKVSQMVLFALRGLSVPDTISCYDRLALKNNIQPLGYPLILKDNNGMKGQINYLIKNSHELDNVLDLNPETVLVAQSFIENDGDYRVLCVGDGERLIFKRVAVEGSHLNNTSQGAQSVKISKTNMPKVAMQLAEDVIKVSGRSVAGVDIVNAKGTDNWYIFEVNLFPAVSAGSFIDEKIDLYINLMNKLLDVEL